MPRGIQPGQCATDALAGKLDTQCKETARRVLAHLKAKHGNQITMEKKLNKDQIPGGSGACAPDGSLWFYRGTLIAAFEAKKQQNAGNAIERWYKNNFICRAINPNVSYVTFACGEGAVVGGVMHKALAVAHLDGFDKLVPKKNSCFMSPQGFPEEEIERIMIETITSQLE
jgi:hypothetical protein